LELLSEHFVPGSKELADAQAEFNSLNAKYEQLDKERKPFSDLEKTLDEQVEKEEFGTNFMKPGIHLHNVSFGGGLTPDLLFGGGPGGTNIPIFLRGAHINPPPLQ